MSQNNGSWKKKFKNDAANISLKEKLSIDFTFDSVTSGDTISLNYNVHTLTMKRISMAWRGLANCYQALHGDGGFNIRYLGYITNQNIYIYT